MRNRKRDGKKWSINANAAKERKRLLEAGDIRRAFEEDEIKIIVKRKMTKEHKEFFLVQANRCDTYWAYVDGKRYVNTKTKDGSFGIHEICKRIASALPPQLSEYAI